MSYIVYCILSTPPAGTSLPPVTGLGDAPVILIGENGLSAAVSLFAPEEMVTDVQALITYGNVIETIYDTFTVIPFRYGNVINSDGEICRFLYKRKKLYAKLLAELAGTVEMGIRILLHPSYPGPDAAGEGNGLLNNQSAASVPRSGRDYLLHRREYYDTLTDHQELIEHCRKPFDGLYRKFHTGTPVTGGCRPPFSAVLLSLYFLIPSFNVTEFLDRFRDFSGRENGKMMVSGPWPPYNFATPDTEGNFDCSRKRIL